MIQVLQKTNLIELFQNNQLDGIAHQTNVERVMGKGIAKIIGDLFPESLEALKSTQGILGDVSYVKTKHGYIWNATAQSYKGMGRKTNYEAFYRCFEQIHLHCSQINPNFKLGVPFGIGCGLGGGDWQIISSMFSALFQESTVKLIICNLQ